MAGVEVQAAEGNGDEDAAAGPPQEPRAAQGAAGGADGGGVVEEAHPGVPHQERRAQRQPQLDRRRREPVSHPRADPPPAQDAAAAEQGALVRRQRRRSALEQEARGDHRLSAHALEDPRVDARPDDRRRPSGEGDPLDPGAQLHVVARERAGRDAVVLDAGGQPGQPARRSREPDLLPRRLHAGPQPGPQLAVDADPGPGPPLLDPEVRMRPASVRSAAPHPVRHAAGKRPLRLQRHPPVAAPGRRRRHAALRPQDVHEAEARAVRHAVALVVAQDRQEHRLAGKAGERPRHRIPDRRPRSLPDHDDQRDAVGRRQRAVPLAHLDRLETPAAFETPGHRVHDAGVDDVAERHAGQRQHLLVRDRVVAVHAEVDDRLRRLRRLRERAGYSEREREHEHERGRPAQGASGAAPGPPGRHRGRPGPTARSRPPVSASR